MGNQHGHVQGERLKRLAEDYIHINTLQFTGLSASGHRILLATTTYFHATQTSTYQVLYIVPTEHK